MIIKGAKVYGDNFEFSDIDVEINDGKITRISENLSGDEVIDAAGCYLVPGLIDTHMHGAMGKTFIDYEDDTFEKIAEYVASRGTTAFTPALSAATRPKLVACVKNLRKYVEVDKDGCAMIYGIHLEGPFFAEKYKGAHLPENIRNPEVDEFDELCDAAEGYAKIITMAPELPGADAVIKRALERGVCVSIGHTNATYKEAKHAIEIGAQQGTHTFNAMSPLHHREPGTVGALLETDARCELICDFFHVNPGAIKIVYKIKGADKINMITDDEMSTGLPDGKYLVNGRYLTVEDGKTYTEDGTIAGGTSCMLDGVKNLVSIGIPLEDAVKMATKNPAETVGIYDRVGSITEGKAADLLVLDKNLNLRHVILRGKLLK